MPSYKLYYFPGKGRGEIIRLVFAHVGVEYEDFRLDRADWPKYKEGAPMGTVPYLEVDGKKLGQSMACARYIAREHGLMGKNAWEEAQVNFVADSATEILEQCVKLHFAKTDEDKEAARQKTAALTKGLEGVLNTHKEGAEYFVGDSLTLADLRVFNVMDMVFEKNPTAKEKLPTLKAHHARISALPGIAAWLKKRPYSAI